MKRLFTIAVLILGPLVTSNASAVASKTFVSASGSDANTSASCSKNQPCRTFAAAYSVTSAGGQIIVIDTGVYGQLTITTPITISAADGVTAIVQVPQNQAGFTVSAGADDLVVLRNITLYGTSTGTIGINHTAGRLIVQNCTFTGLGSAGINSVAKSQILQSSFFGNANGIIVTGEGCSGATCTTAVALIRDGDFVNNSNALSSFNPGVGRQNILLFSTGGGGGGVNTNFSFNTSIFFGVGEGCPCGGPASYTGNLR
jgi:hypothetical protein